MADMAGIFEKRVLQDDQCYAPTLRENERVDINRCPKSETHDHVVMTNRSLDQIIEIVLSFDISNEEKEALISFYKSVPAGMMIVPWSQQFKNNTGGSDGDGDGVIIVRDEGLGKEWNDLAVQLPSGAAEIEGVEEKKEGDPIISLDYKTLRNAYFFNINNENLAVGQVCNYVSKVVSALQSKNNHALFMMADAMGIGCGNKKYSRYITKLGQKLGCKELRELEELGKKYRFETEEELRDFLQNDFLGAAPVMAGLIIDASKKYYEVTVLFWDAFVRAKVNFVNILKKKEYKIGLETKNGVDKITLTAKVNTDEIKGKRKSYETIEIHCPLSELKEEIAKYAAGVVRDIIEMLHVSDEEKNAFFEISTKYEKELAIMDGACKQYADFGSLLAAAASDEDVVSIKRFINNIANNARRLTSHLSLSERGLVVRYASIIKNGQISDTKHSSFMNAFAPEAIAYLLSKEDSAQICGEEIMLHSNTNHKIGDVVKFVNGRSKAGISLDRPITGEFLIEKYGVKTYATTSIKDVLDKSELILRDFDTSKVVFKVQGEALSSIDNLSIDDEIVLASYNKTIFVNKVIKAYGKEIHAENTGVMSYAETVPFATTHHLTMARIDSIEKVVVRDKNNKEITVALVTGEFLKKINRYIDENGKIRTAKRASQKEAPAISFCREYSESLIAKNADYYKNLSDKFKNGYNPFDTIKPAENTQSVDIFACMERVTH